MTKAPFHNKEIEQFMEESTKDGLQGDGLLRRYKEDIIQDKFYNATNDFRRKLRDHLDRKSVAYGKGTGDTIQLRLLSLTTHRTTTLVTQPQSSPASFTFTPHSTPVSTSKRDFRKISRKTQEEYSEPYEGPIIDPVKR